MTNDSIMSIQNMSRRFGSLIAVDNVSLEIGRGTVHAIIGPNGAGKTTLFNMLSGELMPSSGCVRFEAKRIERLRPDIRARRGIGRSFQITSVFPTLSVFENVRIASYAKEGWSRYNFIVPVRETSALNRRALNVLERVGLAEVASIPAGELSHGRQRLLEIALALAGRPRLLLLDEPCAGMGVEDIELMLNLLRDLAEDHTIVIIEHHVELVMAVSDIVTVLDHGRLLVQGTPESVQRHPQVREAYLGVGL